MSEPVPIDDVKMFSQSEVDDLIQEGAESAVAVNSRREIENASINALCTAITSLASAYGTFDAPTLLACLEDVAETVRLIALSMRPES